MTTLRDGRPLGEIETWIFDLDNTLYPASCRLFDQIHARMQSFIAERLGLSPEAALVVQKTYFREHGTTMRGLMIVDRVDPHEFMAYVHDVDLACVPPDPVLVGGAGGTARPQDRPYQRLGRAMPSGCSIISASPIRSAGSSTSSPPGSTPSRRSPAITSCCAATRSARIAR